MKNIKYFFYAVAILIGYVVGAGIFGLPFAMQKIGFLPAVFLLVLLTVTALIGCLSLVEVVLRTRGVHYFPGLAGIYLGKIGKGVQSISTLIGNYGGIIAYLILGKVFLESLLGTWLKMDGIVFLLMFLIVGAVFIWKGYENLGKSEIIMSAFLFGIVVLISLASVDKIELSNYLGFHYKEALSVFGVIIFALSGVGGVFVVRQILAGKEKLFKNSVVVAYVVIFTVSLIFSVAMIGVFGEKINPEAVTGISGSLGNLVEKVAVIFGFLAVFSSFLVVGSNLKNTFHVDFKLPHFISWILVWSIPLLFYLAGFSDFIAIISLVGVVFGAMSMIMITLMLKESRKKGKRNPEFKLRIPLWVNYIIIAFYIIGMIGEIRLFVLSWLQSS
ncbi:MAG: aromatic amino acid transport family protein [Patescibacteria group bacterium]|nr:aromatic amino acid transport family protein [Patescibacteria group bacterium]